MRRNNKSSVYGFYGGVSKENHYIPGKTPPINKWALSQELRNFIIENAQDIVLRKNTVTEPNNIDTFVLSTSGKSEDVIVYKSNTDVVLLDNIAGSGITSDTNEPIDGGTF